MITDGGLLDYAQRLEQAGFTIYEPLRSPARYFRYSRMVNGVECFGYVQKAWTGSGYEHSMPIRPSVQHGSSMWVEGVPNDLSIETAMLVARRSNRNPLVGKQDNYADPDWMSLYGKRGAPCES